MSGFTLRIISVLLLSCALLLLSEPYRERFMLDMTEQSRHTLSSSMLELLGNIKEPLHLRLYFSESYAAGLPVFQSYAARIRSMLEQMRAQSHGNITFEVSDPKPFSETEDMALTQGVQAVPVDEAGAKFFFGLSAENATDRMEIIPFFDPGADDTLEYDLYRIISNLTRTMRPKIGIITTLPVRGGSQTGALSLANLRPWTMLQLLEEAYQIEHIAPQADALPQSLDLLLVIHPSSLPEALLRSVDQFALQGKPLLVFVDPYALQAAGHQRSSTLEPLFASWGIGYSPLHIVAEKDSALYVSDERSGSRLPAFPKITWLGLDENYMGDKSMVTRSLSSIRMAEAGYLEAIKPATTKLTPLLRTTPAAMAVTSEALESRSSYELYRQYVPDGLPRILAAEVSGTINSAFADNQQGELHAIIVADTDMLSDTLWVSQAHGSDSASPAIEADNGKFLLRAIEWLLGDTAMANIPSSTGEVRGFTLLEQQRRQAQMTYRAEEQKLLEKLANMEKRFATLQSSPSERGALFSTAHTEELQQLRADFLATRSALRQIHYQLQADSDAHARRLAWLNILPIAALLLLGALVAPAILRRHVGRG